MCTPRVAQQPYGGRSMGSIASWIVLGAHGGCAATQDHLAGMASHEHVHRSIVFDSDVLCACCYGRGHMLPSRTYSQL